MNSIWKNDGDGWRLATAAGFSAEADLHRLVEEAPQLLPLAGSPQIAVLGSEVRLGTGYADVLAVETSGRPVVIEVKLRSNAESRRAVVTQVLTYAASLRGLSVVDFQSVVDQHIRKRGFSSVFDAVASVDQVGALDESAFLATLEARLADGAFRLVIVLDETPEELVNLVGYLEVVAERLVVDLVTVTQYEVGGSTILVPQRVEPERQVVSTQRVDFAPARANDSYAVEGVDDFMGRIETAPPDQQELLRRLAQWASELEAAGLVRNATVHGKGDRRLTLLPRLAPSEFGPGGAGLVTIWNDTGTAYLSFWRSVFERRAPRALERLDALLSPNRVGQGNTTRDVTPELLAELTAAYREAMAATRDGR